MWGIIKRRRRTCEIGGKIMNRAERIIGDYEFIITGNGRITIYFLDECIAQFQHSELLKLNEIINIANKFADHDKVDESLCPCGHIHKPSSNGNGLRTYCVEGSQCNSDKCKDFVNHAEEGK